jgi:hypothetical protein
MATAMVMDRQKVGRGDATLNGVAGVVGASPERISRCCCCKADRSSEAVWYRRSRSFSTALRMIRSSASGTSGRSWRGAIGCPCRIAAEMTDAVAPVNAGRPVAIS